MKNKVLEFNKLVNTIFNEDSVPLHRPVFGSNEEKYVQQTIESSFVSSVGSFVEQFENNISTHTKSNYSIATVNGTSALLVCLQLAGVKQEDEVLTQALSFVATSNSISYLKAKPIFIDVDIDTMGMSPLALTLFLEEFCEIRDEGTFNKNTGKRIAACLPMHTFGFMCRIDQISKICKSWNIPLIEDAAEALGSSFKGKFAGTFGMFSAFSFNGNKIITSGGGGMILTQNKNLAIQAKHITTTAKKSTNWEYFHDQVGYNFRMPNLNAALGCAQLESLSSFIKNKKKLYDIYCESLPLIGYAVVPIPKNLNWNYWMISIELENKREKDLFLKETNKNGIMTRPIWDLLFKLPMYKDCQKDGQKNALALEDKIINIPSSARS